MTAEFAHRMIAQGPYDVHVITNGKFHENSYVVADRATQRAVAIDPGWDAREPILELNAGGMLVERILLTHGHFDHVGAVQTLCESLGLTADVHEGDRRLLRQAQLYSIRWKKKLLPIPERVRFFSGRMRWDWSGGSIDTIESPGHTPGSVTYRIGDMAFSGDVIFQRKIGPTLYPGGDRAALLESIERLLAELPPSMTLFPGHGRPWSAEAAQAWWRDAAHCPETFEIYAEQGESVGAETQGQRDA